jgi:hypothetical protein
MLVHRNCTTSVGVGIAPVGDPCLWTGFQCDGASNTNQKVINTITWANTNSISISGSLSASFSSLISLVALQISGQPNLVGTIPLGFSALTNLDTLDLHGNRLNGYVPAIFTGLKNKLQTLNLNGNSFDAQTLPSSLSQLTAITSLDISSNYFTGTVPLSLFAGGLTAIKTLNIGDNQLVGSVPSTICSLTNTLKFVTLQVTNNGATHVNTFNCIPQW